MDCYWLGFYFPICKAKTNLTGLLRISCANIDSAWKTGTPSTVAGLLLLLLLAASFPFSHLSTHLLMFETFLRLWVEGLLEREMDQSVEDLLSMHEALGSIPSTTGEPKQNPGELVLYCLSYLHIKIQSGSWAVA